ncbi:MAG: hypothetical protein AB7E63_09105 [Parachlamydia sp.]
MYSHLCWFVEGQATHNPLVTGSSPACPTFYPVPTSTHKHDSA